MPRKIMSFREGRNNISAQKTETGGHESLHEVFFRGIRMYVPSSVKQEMKDMYNSVNDPSTGTIKERRKWAKAYEHEVMDYLAERTQRRLTSFLSRMPTVVETMLNMDKKGYFDRYTSAHLKDIVNIMGQMSELEREAFFKNHGDLFADLSDYYRLLRRYGYSPGTTFALDEKDIQTLHEKGYSSFEEYKKSMTKNIREIKNILKKENPDYWKKAKSGEFDFGKLMAAEKKAIFEQQTLDKASKSMEKIMKKKGKR